MRWLSLTVALIALLAAATTAQADPPGTCTMGTPYTTNLAVTANGEPQAMTAPGVYGPYAVSVCRVTAQTSTYNFSVSRVDASGTNQSDLTQADYDTVFTIAFTPQAGDTPLTAEGKARISAFSIDPYNANTISITARPIGFADIWQCPSAPLQCVIERPTADVYHPANLTGAVRYADPSGAGATGFSDLPGMTLSSGAYVFFVWASCPTNPMRDQSYSGLKIDLGGPHLLPDGTVNTGSVAAYLPAAAVASCFGASPQAYAASAAITRTESGTTTAASTTAGADTGLQYVLSADDTGVTISIPTVTFSQPTYKFGTKSGKALSKTSRTVASLAKSAKVKAPKGGSLRVVVAKASRKVCAAGKSSVYGFGKGTCSYTVQAVTSAGKTSKSAKGSFTVA